MGITEIVLLILIVLTLGLAVLALYNLNKIRRQQWVMTRGMEEASVEEIVTRYIRQVEELEKRFEELKKQQGTHGRTLLGAVQKVGLVRFNAFTDMGGNLSFALALLDQEGNGVLLTSISGRTETRTYAKRVIGGRSELAASQEEEEAIGHAMEGTKR